MENMEKNGIDPNSEYLSAEAFKEMEAELKHLINVRRREISDKLKDSSSQGDLSENAEYQEAKDDQMMNEGRIAELEDLLSRAVIISNEKKKRNQVELGCSVVLKKDGADHTYQLVGSEEADPLKNKISNQSPLGLALLGKKKGEKAKVVTPSGEVVYTVKDIQ
ncbi:MAG: transcription elongation factor GreA [Candidatus Marinimicrobia bacterium]|nr:transcription elongation factor GreA [Candidatus Neomarinimicrobiota bacterium]